MIKATELMIGNLFKDKDGNILLVDEISSDLGVYVVDATYDSGLKRYPFKNIFGIDLTPEILEKCGFVETSVKFTNGNTSVVKRSIELTDRLTVIVNGSTVVIEEKPERTGEVKYTQINDVQHLHSLQNIVHALTGEELTYTP